MLAKAIEESAGVVNLYRVMTNGEWKTIETGLLDIAMAKRLFEKLRMSNAI